MSKAKTRVEGFIAEPRLNRTRQGEPVLSVSVGHTPRKRSQTDPSGWEDAGPTLWARASFWGDEAEHLHQVLQRGDFVILEGEPVLSMFTDRNGQAGVNLELKFATIAVVPRAPRQQQGGFGQQPQPQWAQQSAPAQQPEPQQGQWPTSFDDEQPF